jgi:tellurite resistance protein TehA-like permease
VSDDFEHHAAAPPSGEQIHMPGPSVLPLVNAAALAFAIVSITLSWWLVGFGVLIFLVTAIKWIGDTRRDIADLPLEHGEPH